MRRTLIITGIVLVVLGIGVAIYFIFFARPAVTVAPGTTLPGAGQTTPTTGGTGTNAPGTGSPITVAPRLVQISKGPVVPGEVVVDKKPANASSTPETTVRYIERQSGNVFSYSVGSQTLTRTNNKTLPGIQSAMWLPNGSVAFVRYLSGTDSSTINTYALSATSSDGFFLAQDLADIAVSSTSILTLASGANGSVASLQNTNGTHATPVFTSPLSVLRISYAGKGQYLAFSKPSGNLSGDAFLIDNAGYFSRIAGPRNGLVALASPLGKWVLVSSSRGTTMQTELVNTATNETLSLPIATIADKCVWAADDSAIYCGVPVSPPFGVTYPDDWYQGAVQFSDRIWKIQVQGRYAQLVLDFPKEAKDSLDAESLVINPQTQHSSL
jgi:hypothetical protein